KDELLNFKTPDIDYIIFLDPDDYWELNCIEKCVSKMDGVEVIWFDWRYHYNLEEFEITIKLLSQTLFERLNYKESQKITQTSFLKNMIKDKQDFFVYVWQGMVDFHFLKSIQLQFVNQITYAEDALFGIMLFAQCNNILCLQKNYITIALEREVLLIILEKNLIFASIILKIIKYSKIILSMIDIEKKVISF
ncbi:glycosyltransferase, partial [Campylobacter sp. 2457A]|uniref:glycosyltransferase n=1 Tax=Campylobacter sp. 2457A TaxID=2735784 RepID=UPI00301CDB71|nr:glycosyltransferase family 2 protein [Campylobacter sp. 2457A]